MKKHSTCPKKNQEEGGIDIDSSPAAVVADEVEDADHGAPAEGAVTDEAVQGDGERAGLRVDTVGEVDAVPLLARRGEAAPVRHVARVRHLHHGTQRRRPRRPPHRLHGPVGHIDLKPSPHGPRRFGAARARRSRRVGGGGGGFSV